jgi:hypothetical protein
MKLFFILHRPAFSLSLVFLPSSLLFQQPLKTFPEGWIEIEFEAAI